ncbi:MULTISPECIES: Crp/Fnr family transcriptional regulator [Oceanobacillus]|uniref:Transcriptional regulator YeiL n=1 Tax=Oceanobacillus neutriphilus TaxID=531815 RepID=A0ABQ2NVY5_9BACI|nr:MULTISPECIES: Crp/Fnr family transcriptional regulator [Oceanobacillus]MCT1904606.1 Crp/Fnr family transcriptional regulator [Oceanobacillus sojae]GGP11888.1 transcriptional regulator YeiL [Oceanobacillus neutriphilus]
MALKQFAAIYHYSIPNTLEKEITIRTYKINEYILTAGEEIDGFYFLISGKYFVSSQEITGKELLLRYCQTPAIMGDIEILEDCLIQSNCIAAEPCTFVFIPKKIYEKELKYDASFSQILLRELAYKLRTCTISSRVNALSPANVRLAAFLCTVSSDSQVSYISTNNLEETAALIGTTKRHVNRILKQWMDQGIVERENDEVRILQWDKVKEISEDVRFE